MVFALISKSEFIFEIRRWIESSLTWRPIFADLESGSFGLLVHREPSKRDWWSSAQQSWWVCSGRKTVELAVGQLRKKDNVRCNINHVVSIRVELSSQMQVGKVENRDEQNDVLHDVRIARLDQNVWDHTHRPQIPYLTGGTHWKWMNSIN